MNLWTTDKYRQHLRPKEGFEPNLPLLRKVYEHILDHPEEWYQWSWHFDVKQYREMDPTTLAEIERDYHPLCDTAFCFAGHAVAMTEGFVNGLPSSGLAWSHAANHHLGLTPEQGSALYSGINTIDDIREILGAIFEYAGERL